MAQSITIPFVQHILGFVPSFETTRYWTETTMTIHDHICHRQHPPTGHRLTWSINWTPNSGWDRWDQQYMTGWDRFFNMFQHDVCHPQTSFGSPNEPTSFPFRSPANQPCSPRSGLGPDRDHRPCPLGRPPARVGLRSFEHSMETGDRRSQLIYCIIYIYMLYKLNMDPVWVWLA